ncbi:MAG TPA: SHOCT domain-containing protein [bacterium]
MWGMNGGMGAGWMVAMMGVNLLIGVGLLALVIVGVVAGIRWLSRIAGGYGNSPRSDPALDVLRERYAKGEIGRDEFERMRRDVF